MFNRDFMRYLILILITLNLISKISYASISFESGNSPLVPNNVLNYFSQASNELKSQYCEGNTSVTEDVKKLAKIPPKRISGFNSKMNNQEEVEGIKVLDEFSLRMSQLQTSAWALKQDKEQNLALDSLFKWAKSNALLETYNCREGDNPKCTQWTRADGQDLSKSMDYSKAQMEIMHLAYAYYSLLSSYKPESNKHIVIDKWFQKFVKRNKPPAKFTNLGFGLDFGWSWPGIVFGHLKNESSFSSKNAKKIVNRAVQKLDILLLEDGSIKNRTSRGDRALWYHFTGLIETVLTLEMARALNVVVPKSLDSRIERGFKLFINGFENHSFMDKWASKAHNSTFTAGYQNFYENLDVPNGNSAFYIFAYRYPNSKITKKLEHHLVKFNKTASTDGYLGFGLGCIYAVAKNVRYGEVLSDPSKSVIKKSKEYNLYSPEIFMPNFSVQLIKQENAFPSQYSTLKFLNKFQNKKYQELSFRVFDWKTENFTKQQIKLKLMFDYKNEKYMKMDAPFLIRLSVKYNQLTGNIDLKKLKSCHHANFKIKNGKLDNIRLSYGEDAKDNNCIMSALSIEDRETISGIYQNTFKIIESFDSNHKGLINRNFINFLN